MARTPVRIQSGNFGTDNPSSSTPSYANRSAPQPAVLQRGPSQGREQFTADSLGDSASVARALNAIQSSVDTAVGPSKNNPFADGNLVERVSFTGGTNIIKHGLGAAARGFVIMNSDTSAITYKVAQNPATLDEQTISIFASTPFTGDVWVYK